MNFKNWFTYKLPRKWRVQQEEDNLLMFNPNGEGALVLSFFKVTVPLECLQQKMEDMAERFIDQNNIKSETLPEFFDFGEKRVLCRSGEEPDGYFVKIWIVSNGLKAIVATYHSEEENAEVKLCNAFIESIFFR